MYFDEALKPQDFRAVRLTVASPDTIRQWSHGEVTKPETINYRTQKPEKDGLFSERIFGPTKDWECYCGKYKRIRYKGIVCDKCGVEVTRSIVRRERFGHIELAAPVSHIWFLRGVPSKIGLSLDMSVMDLEKVIYFANFIITHVDEEARSQTFEQIEQEAKSKKKSLESEFKQVEQEIHKKREEAKAKAKNADEMKKHEELFGAESKNARMMHDEKMKELDSVVVLAKKELQSLAPLMILSESQYQDLSLKYGHVFDAGIGAEAMKQLLSLIDLNKEIRKLEDLMVKAAENKKRRLLKRLKLLKNFKKNGLRPEWMVLSAVPVIPPDLRPMVQLDGGRFATSDLNDLYRRVINRNNRLKRLMELNSPEVITRNEKRMLQEAVDALIDNSARHGKTVTASTGQKRQLKSIADMLKGKQGRFRQNLLGKRVDYSGRSVIVVGPHLKLNQCGLPKRMALELFKPFVISELIKREYVHNVRSANRFIESDREEVWDILEGITKKAHVFLNRAPTLHRLGIQAFQPVLIEGKAIQLHPLVCPPFNADFDGDQMAVHVPLTEMAKFEARELMISTKNLLKPATGKPVITPSQDTVLGCFYLTNMRPEKAQKACVDASEAICRYRLGQLHLQEPIRCHVKGNKFIDTSVGRIIFNQVLPDKWPYRNETFNKKTLSALVTEHLNAIGHQETVLLLDSIMQLSFEYLTRSGISWGMSDLVTPKEKPKILNDAQAQVDAIHENYEMGLLTDDERRARVIETWDLAKQEIQAVSKKALDPHGPVFSMIESGARGSWGQTTQMMGMKGLVTNPRGDIIELPVKGSFKEGFSVLEYFISTHGARKGLSDTALRTANAGYLTRRLVDVSQDVVIMAEDCGDEEGINLTREETEALGEDFLDRLLGRCVLDAIKDQKTKKVIVKKGETITPELLKKLAKAKFEEARIRSTLTCRTARGLCQKCYGFDLGYNTPVKLGTAVGIIAAQSIGEPGTQLTMRTFHTGGVAGQDITQGLPRVEELFEARPVKKPAFLAEAQGKVAITEEQKENGEKLRTITLTGIGEEIHRYSYPKKDKADVKVEEGKKIKKGAVLFSTKKEDVKSEVDGKVRLEDECVVVIETKEKQWAYQIPFGYIIVVKDGAEVERGDRLTEGSIELHQLYELKGKFAVQKYVIQEIQNIYSTQGQKLNDKHIEIIVRQMFSRVYVRDAGDTDLMPGEIIEISSYEEANTNLKKGEKPALVDILLLGITKASLSIDSFFSAASFQETARVLIDAAVSGKVDHLRGLKENVIIGRLIPGGTGYGVDYASNLEDTLPPREEEKRPVEVIKEEEAEKPLAEPEKA
jgi:DNA-directed RNA polymerase subunit beta'